MHNQKNKPLAVWKDPRSPMNTAKKYLPYPIFEFDNRENPKNKQTKGNNMELLMPTKKVSHCIKEKTKKDMAAIGQYPYLKLNSFFVMQNRYDAPPKRTAARKTLK